jgi:small subunit ribosomal protein S8
MVIDTISDMLTRIRNANLIKHETVQIPYTKITAKIALILKEEGFIKNFEIYYQYKTNTLYFDEKKYLFISLKYHDAIRSPIIKNIKRISKPGLRVYSNKKNIPTVLSNMGIAIISTSQGLMTNIKAKQLGIGGEILCYIW